MPAPTEIRARDGASPAQPHQVTDTLKSSDQCRPRDRTSKPRPLGAAICSELAPRESPTAGTERPGPKLPPNLPPPRGAVNDDAAVGIVTPGDEKNDGVVLSVSALTVADRGINEDWGNDGVVLGAPKYE